MIEGGCFCGSVRYRAGGKPSHETLCHCTTCRRTSGAPVVAWLSVPSDSYELTAGEPARFRSSDHGTRSFCPRCGTPLSYQSDALSAEIDLTICSLDAPERFAPRDHTFTRSRLAWLSLRDALPAFPGTRD